MNWGALVGLLDKLAGILQRFLATREQRKAQDERTELEQNPSGWFAGKFGSVHQPADKDKADSANPPSPPST